MHPCFVGTNYSEDASFHLHVRLGKKAFLIQDVAPFPRKPASTSEAVASIITQITFTHTCTLHHYGHTKGPPPPLSLLHPPLLPHLHISHFPAPERRCRRGRQGLDGDVCLPENGAECSDWSGSNWSNTDTPSTPTTTCFRAFFSPLPVAEAFIMTVQTCPGDK